MPRPPPRPRPIPPVDRDPKPATATELWYLECLRLLTAHYGRPPSIPELARYCRRGLFPTWEALCKLEKKGRLTRTKDRKFVIEANQ